MFNLKPKNYKLNQIIEHNWIEWNFKGRLNRTKKEKEKEKSEQNTSDHILEIKNNTPLR